MGYILKLFDTDLIWFNVVENLTDPVLEITKVNTDHIDLMPRGMNVDETGLSKWIKSRAIPKNRAFVNAFLSKCGLSVNRPMDIISVCRGLSLNDSYWVSEDNTYLPYDKVNLYENNFSQVLAWVAFTGYGSSGRSTFASSPEFTTNGILPKCWRRISSKVYLYKGATSGFSNTGNEPYSEKYAYFIGKAMDFDVIQYTISKWKGNFCSVCEIFTNKEVSYVPIGRIVKSGGMRAVRAYYEQLGNDFVRALNEMIVFDAVICNTDRHFGNFGLLINSRTNEIIGPAPLFDHGNSLFNMAGEENWETEEKLKSYISTLLPQTYDDFITEAKSVLDADIRKKLRKGLEFSFTDSGRYNYSRKKIKLIEKIIRERIYEILNQIE